MSYLKYATYNRRYIIKSELCSCVSCLKTYKSTKVVEYVDNNSTALCPICGIDAVVPHSLFVPSKEQLSMWNKEGFDPID